MVDGLLRKQAQFSAGPAFFTTFCCGNRKLFCFTNIPVYCNILHLNGPGL
jgi:hypothetical protein